MSLTVEKCLQAWTNSFRQMNAKADIVFFGDSLTYYGDFSSVFPDKIVCNLGLRGDTIQGMIDRAEQVKLLEPKVVYLMAGINDIASYLPVQLENLYEKLIQKLLFLLSGQELAIQSILPVNDKAFTISCNNNQILKFNSNLRKLAIFYKLPYIDLFSAYVVVGVMPEKLTKDGIHLQQEAYKQWYDMLKK